MNTFLLASIWEGETLPVIFAFLLGLSLLIYVILDGYDLGVGILSRFAKGKDKDIMIASVGPFWDANETWLVLGGGLLLVAFPHVHGIIFQHLYLPVAVMLIGLILRGVSFDFRAKVPAEKKYLWDNAFFWGSLITTLAQGYMMGMFMTGFAPGWGGVLFSVLTAIFAVFAYSLVGSGWLLMKTDELLQKRSIQWGQYALFVSALGSLFVAIASPTLSPAVAAKWLDWSAWPLYIFPLLIFFLFLLAWMSLKKLGDGSSKKYWVPFAASGGIFLLNFVAIAFSFYPWIIVDKASLMESAASNESLMIILVGALVCLPLLIGYTIVAYRVFHGKATHLSYK